MFGSIMKTVKGWVSPAVAFVTGLVASSAASAASVLTAADKTAITAGYQGFQDTVVDIIGVSWSPFLTILAVLSAPFIVKKIISLAKS